MNLLLYHGVLGGRSAWRRAIVPGVVWEAREASGAAPEPPTETAPPPGRILTHLGVSAKLSTPLSGTALSRASPGGRRRLA